MAKRLRDVPGGARPAQGVAYAFCGGCGAVSVCLTDEAGHVFARATMAVDAGARFAAALGQGCSERRNVVFTTSRCNHG